MIGNLKTLGSILMSCAFIGSLPAAAAQEESYPAKMLHIIVPYPPGGFNDTLGRVVAAKLSKKWGQSVVVENKPGAGTMIGTSQVARAPADGYTVLVSQFPFAANPFLYKSMSYDSRADFVPVVLAGRSPMVLVVNAETPYKSAQDVVNDAQAHPGDIAYGSSGSGSSNHLAMALFEQMSKTKMNQVPYRGSSPMLTDLSGGQVKLAFDALPHALPFIQTGKIRPLAIANKERSPLMPELPTVSESGVKDYEVHSWHGFMVKAGTPEKIIQQLNQDINAVLAQKDVQAMFREQGVVPDGGSSKMFAQFIEQQMKLWEQVVHDAGIPLQ